MDLSDAANEKRVRAVIGAEIDITEDRRLRTFQIGRTIRVAVPAIVQTIGSKALRARRFAKKKAPAGDVDDRPER